MARAGEELGTRWAEIVVYTKAHCIYIVADLWTGRARWKSLEKIHSNCKRNLQSRLGMLAFVLAFLRESNGCGALGQRLEHVSGWIWHWAGGSASGWELPMKQWKLIWDPPLPSRTNLIEGGSHVIF